MWGLAAEVGSEPLERAFGIVVQQDPHQLEHVLVFKDEIHHFTHVVILRLAYVEAYVEALVISVGSAVATAPAGPDPSGDAAERYRVGYGR
jgi:hypothetical protein